MGLYEMGRNDIAWHGGHGKRRVAGSGMTLSIQSPIQRYKTRQTSIRTYLKNIYTIIIGLVACMCGMWQ